MARRAFEVQVLRDSELAQYDHLAQYHGTVFDSAAWTNLFGDALTRYGIYDAGGSLRGGFCLFRQRKLGLPVLRNPPLTPYIGPFFEFRAQHPVAMLEESRQVLTAIADCLESIHPAVVSVPLARWVTDSLPFLWRDYKVTPHYTYLLPLDQTDEAILAGMSESRRRNIGKARRDGLRAERTEVLSIVSSLVEATFARQGKHADSKYVKRILFSFARPDNSYAFVVQSSGVPIAGSFVVHCAETAYYLLGGYDTRVKHHGAGALAMFESIRHAREIGLQTFDFEGSVVPAIERYFRGFGGRLTPRFRVSKAWLPLEMALKLSKRRLF
ncbi:MAG: GNAT family N-acetyltransferase [candidate division WOR-3 bacterium]|nr:MAG: GNAT family N-acetyltransferase [candidate division WOR-3 bacterium]